MDLEKQITTLLQEAELYQSQGLMLEAKGKYDDLAELIRENEDSGNMECLLHDISKGRSALEDNLQRIKNTQEFPEMPRKVQDLIKNLFSFSRDNGKDRADLEGAITLAEFGQFGRALNEFNELIKNDSLRVVAAQNILRCHFGLSSIDNAINQYQEWISSNLFSSEQMEEIRIYLETLLAENGMDKEITQLKQTSEEMQHDIEEDDQIEISFIEITLGNGSQERKQIDIEVDFQKENMIKVLISNTEKELIECLKVGYRLNDVRFFSPFATFKGSAVVSARNQINSGTKKGYYTVDIEIDTI